MSEAVPSTRPYLVRAIYEWCSDNGFTPFIAVLADESVQVPRQYVKDGEIVLNIGAAATSGLRIGNELLEFSARFGGVAHDIMIPVDRVLAIYARENGQGMAFTLPGAEEESGELHDDDGDEVELLEPADDEEHPGPTIQLVPPAGTGGPEPGDDSPKPPDGRSAGGRRGVLKRIK